MNNKLSAPFGGKPYVFISYSHKDSDYVVSVIRKLKGMGYRVWYDEAIPHTTRYDEIIANAIDCCALFVVFFSQYSASAEYVIDEVHRARNRNKLITPVMLDDVELDSGTDMRLERIQKLFHYINNPDGQGNSGEDEFIAELCSAMVDCRDETGPLSPAEPVYRINKDISKPIKETEDNAPARAAAPSKPESAAPLLEEPVSVPEISTVYEPETLPGVLAAGDIIPFGRYPQKGSAPEPVMWRVLAVEEGRALLLSESLLDCKRFNERYGDVTWEQCSLRAWLNGAFFGAAFVPGEQDKIIAVSNENPDNPAYGLGGGAPTSDRVFCLSAGEAERYFSDDSDRTAAPTAFAVSHGSWTSSRYSVYGGARAGWWWLRTSGFRSGYAAGVRDKGDISVIGYYADLGGGSVRPAVWVKLG